MPKKLLSLLCATLLLLSTLNIPAMAGDDPAANPFADADHHRDKLLASMMTEQADEHGDAATVQAQKSAEVQKTLAASQPRYIVKFKDDVALTEIFDGIKDAEFTVIGDSSHHMFTILADHIDAVKASFGDKIEFAEEDAQIQSDSITNDEFVDRQWAVPALNLPDTWNRTKGANTVYVAVIDSGYDMWHEDLESADIRAGHDYLLGGACDWDSTGHGTSVTGIIAATPNNGIGIAGACWNVAVVPLLVTHLDGSLSLSDTCNAIYAAADLGCDVINMSFGGATSYSSQAQAIQYAVSKGCILVAAAGNDGTTNYSYPASFTGVISTGSVNSSLQVSSFSQKNNAVEVCAPGEQVVSTADPYWTNNYKYEEVDGTSFSAPYVSAIAALARSINSKISPAQFQDAMNKTATDLGPAGYDSAYGFGMINPPALLDYIASTYGVTQYTVSFDSQGGDAVASVTVAPGSAIPAPVPPTCQGYTFAGWYKDAAHTTPWDFSTDVVTANTTLYANWTCNVSFETFGGSAVAPVTANVGSIIAAPANPVYPGLTFGGWYNDVGCTTPWNFGSDTVTQDTILYAGWTAQAPSNYLQGISLSAGALNRGFAPTVTGYTVNLGENDPAVTITPAKAYDFAMMTIDGKAMPAKTISLANGKSANVTIKVTLGKKSTTYKLKVQRAKSTDNALAALNASGGSWSQPFDPAVTSYTLDLPENMGKVSLNAVRASGLATVSPAKGSFTLKNGQTVRATFKVKAQSGAVRTYTVLITRARSTNANLGSLKLSAKGMAPGFNPAVTDYAITLPAKTAAVTIAAKAADKLSTVRINGAPKASLAVKLANGQTTAVTVTVTAQSGDVKTYTIAVSRQ